MNSKKYLNTLFLKNLEIDQNQIVHLQNDNYPKIIVNNLKQIICSGLPNIIDIDKNQFVDLLNNKNIHSIQYCEDATMIKIFYQDDQWKFVTKNNIDASQSKWTSRKSFQQLFFEIFPKSSFDFISSKLDVNKTYIFLLKHKENFNVLPVYNNCLYYICSIDNISHEICDFQIFQSSNIKSPQLISHLGLSSIDDIENYYKPNKRGILIKTFKNNCLNIYKYDFEQFKIIQQKRGNFNNIQLCIFNLILNNDFFWAKKFCQQNQLSFYLQIQILKNYCRFIHSLYIDTYVNKTKINVDNINLQIIRGLHSIYFSQKQAIFLHTVEQYIKINFDKKFNQLSILKFIEQ